MIQELLQAGASDQEIAKVVGAAFTSQINKKVDTLDQAGLETVQEKIK